MSRSIVIEMERRPGQTDCSRKPSDPVFIEIRRKLARWADDVGDLSRFHLPQNAASMRGYDNWNVFFRVACAVSESVAKELLGFIPYFVNEEQDFDTYLLSSIRDACNEDPGVLRKGGHLGSQMILNALNADTEAPWFRKDDKGLTREKLAARLRRYKIKPEQCWHPDIKLDVRGYYYIHPEDSRNGLKRVFDQYLPEEPKEQ